MNARLRLLAAILALFALSAYVAEGVLASLCPPAAETGGVVAGERADPGAHAGLHHVPTESQGETEHSRSDAPPCPMGMAGAGSSCVAVSLPATVAVVQPAATIHEAALLLLEHGPDLLLVAAHFRPPRA
jgi:hypothetical protein